MKRKLLCSIILLLFSICILAQTGKVNYPNLGLSFTVPEGWTGNETNGIYLMGHTSVPGLIVIVPHDQPLTVAQMNDEMKRGLQFDAGTLLQLTGSINSMGSDAVSGDFTGTFDYSSAQAYIIGLANSNGNGLTIIAVTSPESYQLSTYKDLAIAVKNSVEFSAIDNSPGTAGESETSANALADWKYQLGGTKLTYMESYNSGGEYGGGYNMKTEIHLCIEGYFKYYDQSFVAAGGSGVSGYSSGSSQGHGEWEIKDQNGATYLILGFHDGQQKHFKLEWGESYKLYLDGYRYFRTWEGEQAPHCTD